MVWKYLFLWQLDQPASGDTGGLSFPKAIQHTFAGFLFVIARNEIYGTRRTYECYS